MSKNGDLWSHSANKKQTLKCICGVHIMAISGNLKEHLIDIMRGDITNYGGPLTGTRRRIKYFADTNCTVYSISYKPVKNVKVLPKSKYIHYIYLSHLYDILPSYLTTIPYMLNIFIIVIYLHIKYGLKYVSVHDIYATFACCLTKLFFNLKITTIFHGPPAYELVYFNEERKIRWIFLLSIVKKIESLACKYSDNIVVISEFEKEKINNHTEKEVHIIRNGVDTDDFKPLNVSINDIPSDKMIVTFVGRLVRKNGPDLLIRAALNVLNCIKNVHFIVVGDGELEEELKTYVINNKLETNVTFLGKRYDVKEILNSSDIFCSHCSTLVEGVGNNVIEALAVGLPCIVGEDSITKNIFQNYENGILVRKDKPQEIANAICYLLNDENKRKEISNKARKLAIDEFSLATQMNKLKYIIFK